MVWIVPLLVALHQAWLYSRLKRFDPFSIYTILDFAILVIVTGGTVFSPAVTRLAEQDFGFAALFPAGQLALYIGLHFFGPTPRQPADHAPPAKSPGVFWLAISSSLYLAISVAIALVYMTLGQTSLTEWLLGQRAAAYAIATNIGFGAILNNLSMAAQVGLLVWLMLALQNRQFLRAAILYGVLFLGMFLIFTTRFQLLVILALPIFYFHYHVRNLGPALIATLLAAMVSLAAILNLFRGGGIEATQELTADNLVALSSIDRGTYLIEPVALLYSRFRDGDIEYEYGANYLYAFVTFVPRQLWPDKPLTAFENRMTNRLFDTVLDEGGTVSVWTFTAWGEGFAQFDAPGVVLNLLLYGLVLALAYRYCQARPHLFFVWIYYSLLAAAYLRAGFQALFILTLNMVLVAALLHLLPKVKIVYKPKSKPEPEPVA